MVSVCRFSAWVSFCVSAIHSPLYQPRKMCIMHAWLSHFDLASETLTGKISASVNHSLKSIAYLLIFSRHTWVPSPPSCPLYLQSRLGLLRLIPRVGTRRNIWTRQKYFFLGGKRQDHFVPDFTVLQLLVLSVHCQVLPTEEDTIRNPSFMHCVNATIDWLIRHDVTAANI